MPHLCFLFFFNDTATTEIYTLSLHDALPISGRARRPPDRVRRPRRSGDQIPSISFPRTPATPTMRRPDLDRKSTRLNSSHSQISYAVFCLKKKNNQDRSSSTIDHDRTTTR